MTEVIRTSLVPATGDTGTMVRVFVYAKGYDVPWDYARNVTDMHDQAVAEVLADKITNYDNVEVRRANECPDGTGWFYAIDMKDD